MKYSEFEKLVVDFMNRDKAVFEIGVEGGVNKVRAAANMAKQWAQRETKFELGKCKATVTLDSSGFALLSTAVLKGTQVPLTVSWIERAAVGTTYLDVWTEQQKIDYMDRASCSLTPGWYGWTSQLPDSKLIRHGDKVYLWPWATTQAGLVIELNVVRQFPDYASDNDEDFFLSHCSDWLLFRTIFYLNNFLRADQRIRLDGEVMDEAWQTVLNWNARLEGASVATNLD